MIVCVLCHGIHHYNLLYSELKHGEDKIFSKCRTSVTARTLNQDFTVYTNGTVVFLYCPTTDLTEYTRRHHDSYFTPFPICKVAMAIQLMCQSCGNIVDAI
jgi:hypothetical protein